MTTCREPDGVAVRAHGSEPLSFAGPTPSSDAASRRRIWLVERCGDAAYSTSKPSTRLAGRPTSTRYRA
jgi:hypothetical protein